MSKHDYRDFVMWRVQDHSKPSNMPECRTIGYESANTPGHLFTREVCSYCLMLESSVGRGQRQRACEAPQQALEQMAGKFIAWVETGHWHPQAIESKHLPTFLEHFPKDLRDPMEQALLKHELKE